MFVLFPTYVPAYYEALLLKLAACRLDQDLVFVIASHLRCWPAAAQGSPDTNPWQVFYGCMRYNKFLKLFAAASRNCRVILRENGKSVLRSRASCTSAPPRLCEPNRAQLAVACCFCPCGFGPRKVQLSCQTSIWCSPTCCSSASKSEHLELFDHLRSFSVISEAHCSGASPVSTLRLWCCASDQCPDAVSCFKWRNKGACKCTHTYFGFYMLYVQMHSSLAMCARVCVYAYVYMTMNIE